MWSVYPPSRCWACSACKGAVNRTVLGACYCCRRCYANVDGGEMSRCFVGSAESPHDDNPVGYPRKWMRFRCTAGRPCVCICVPRSQHPNPSTRGPCRCCRCLLLLHQVPRDVRSVFLLGSAGVRQRGGLQQEVRPQSLDPGRYCCSMVFGCCLVGVAATSAFLPSSLQSKSCLK